MVISDGTSSASLLPSNRLSIDIPLIANPLQEDADSDGDGGFVNTLC